MLCLQLTTGGLRGLEIIPISFPPFGKLSEVIQPLTDLHEYVLLRIPGLSVVRANKLKHKKLLGLSGTKIMFLFHLHLHF